MKRLIQSFICLLIPFHIVYQKIAIFESAEVYLGHYLFTIYN